MENKPGNLTFTYEQSPDFSVRYADGPGIKPMAGGNIYVGFYLERRHEFDSVRCFFLFFLRLLRGGAEMFTGGSCRVRSESVCSGTDYEMQWILDAFPDCIRGDVSFTSAGLVEVA